MVKKGKKKQYAKLINKILGTDIAWEKLTVEDLVKFASLLENPENLIKRIGGKELGGQIFKMELLDKGLKILDHCEGPVINTLKTLMGRIERNK